jgi:hypothetical protein
MTYFILYRMETYQPHNPHVKPIDENDALYLLISQYSQANFDDFHEKLALWAKHGFSFGLDDNNDVVMIEPTATDNP